MRCSALPCSSCAELVSIQCGVSSAHRSSCRICVSGKNSSKTTARSSTRERSAVSAAAASTVTGRDMEELLEYAAGEGLEAGGEGHQLRVLFHAFQLRRGRVRYLRREPGEGVPHRVDVSEDAPGLLGVQVARAFAARDHDVEQPVVLELRDDRADEAARHRPQIHGDLALEGRPRRWLQPSEEGFDLLDLVQGERLYPRADAA